MKKTNRKAISDPPGRLSFPLFSQYPTQTNNLRQIEADLLAWAAPAQLAQALKDYEPNNGFDSLNALDILMGSIVAPPSPPHRRKR